MKNPLTKRAFAKWCGEQPADTAYPYDNCGGHCAFGQYLVSLGKPVEFVALRSWYGTDGKDRRLPKWVDKAVIGDGYHARYSHTFGRLAQRLRSA